jgi:PhnB protein
MMPESHVPPQYRSFGPYLIVAGAREAIGFYERAFGFVERLRLETPDGFIGHAELTLGDAVLMVSEEVPALGFYSPAHYGGTPVTLALYVPDVDAAVARAVAAGAKPRRPVEDQFYGDRSGSVVDPFGHVWTLATHVEDVSPQEMNRRFQAMCGGPPA